MTNKSTAMSPKEDPPISGEMEAMMEAMQEGLRARMEAIVEEQVRERLNSILNEHGKLDSLTTTNFQSSYGISTAAGNQNNNSISNDVEDGSNSHRENISENKNDIKNELFCESTHKLLFLDTIPLDDDSIYTITCWDRFMALSVIAFQMFTYYILIHLVGQETRDNGFRSDRRSLEIATEYCHDPETTLPQPQFYYETLTESGQVTSETLLDLLKCSELNAVAEGSAFNLTYSVAGILLYFFLLPDLLEVYCLFWYCKGWRCKLTAIIIFLKAALAMVVAICGAAYSQGAFSVLDIFLFAVGVIFVHDLDEQFGHLRSVLRTVNHHRGNVTNGRWCSACCNLEVQFSIFVFSLFVLSGVINIFVIGVSPF